MAARHQFNGDLDALNKLWGVAPLTAANDS